MKFLKALLPVIAGHYSVRLFDLMFEITKSYSVEDDMSTPGIIFLIEFIVKVVFVLILVIVQYFFINRIFSKSVGRSILFTTAISVFSVFLLISFSYKISPSKGDFINDNFISGLIVPLLFCLIYWTANLLIVKAHVLLKINPI